MSDYLSDVPFSDKILVCDDVIKTAKELQAHLASQPPDEQPVIAAQAIDVIGDPREIYGSHDLYIHSLGSFVLANGLSEDAALYHGTYFADVYMGGRFGRMGYVRHSALRSICFLMYDTKIVDSQSNPEFNGETVRSGVFVPVQSIESVFAA